MQAGQSANYTFSAAPAGGSTFSGAVNFACANLPALTNCNFNPASIAAGAGTTTVMLTITTTGPIAGSQSQKAPLPTSTPKTSGKQETPIARTVGSAMDWLAIPLVGMLLATAASRRTTRTPAVVACLLALAALTVLAACGGLGGNGGGGGPPPLVRVTVSPTVASLYENEAGNTWPASATQKQFTATVSNATSQTVTWSVGGSAEGTIDSTGLYTAPATVPSPATVTVTATSALATSPGTATVTILAATPIGTFSNIQVTATAAGGPANAVPVTLTVD